ncbi:MAG: hypothetical protein JF593_01965 [Novosphingobium sp.]|nr:hypothetical protein [Novosphingobium sp.]
MDAPLYRPALAWEAPVEVPQRLSTRETSLGEFVATPFAKQILESEVPGFEGLIGNPMLAPHLGNMSPRMFVQFGMFKAEALDKVDAKLAAYYASHGAPK